MPEGVGYGPQFTASIGKTLNYIGKHVYAFSGGHGANTTPVSALDFTTGSNYIKGRFYISVGLENGTASSAASYSNIKFNGQLVANMWAGFGAADAMSLAEVEVIIPPYTEVTATLYGDENQATRKMCMTFTGKLYGAID